MSFLLIPFLFKAAYAMDATITPSPEIIVQVSDPISMIRSGYELALAMGGALALVMIVIAGIRYATSVGDPHASKDAIDQLFQAALGILLLFGAYILLRTINPSLTTLKLPSLAPVDTTVYEPPANTGGGGGGGGGGSTNCTVCKDSPALTKVLDCVKKKAQKESVWLGSIITHEQRHSVGSCHFGGKNCVSEGSHAVDFGNERSHEQIFAFVRDCAASEGGYDQACYCETPDSKRPGCGAAGINHIHCNIDTNRCDCN
jgi:hypothetical protein